MKPSEIFGREDRFFNHYASKTFVLVVCVREGVGSSSTARNYF